MSLPSQALLLELLTYEPTTGYLYWNQRGKHHFASERLWKSWNSTYAGKRAFTALSKKGYHVGSVLAKNYRANRIIWMMQMGTDPIQIDHENGIRSDDRWLNLREVTGQDNQKNMKKAVNNTSGHTGVCWDAAKNKWSARIKANGKSINLGRFNDINDAIAARQQAEIDYGFHPNHGKR